MGGGRHAPRREERPHRRGRGLLVLLLLFLMLGGGAGAMYVYATGSSGASMPVAFTVPKGATAAEVSEMLEDRGIVRSAFAFRLVARLRGASIQAGDYELKTNLRPQQALDMLERGPKVEKTVTLTIPEGLRVDQVAEKVAETLPIGPPEFVELAESGNHALPPYLPEKAKTVEGFLFPKTYELSPEADADAVISRLLEQFQREAEALPWDRAKKLGLSEYEVVILASLIEREARVPEDRAKISSVIHNRLEKGMPLQIDATVQYALPEHKPRLTYKDYEVESPYNTYLRKGLPPSPIASPGLASLEAALRPAKTNFFFYLVVDESGRHGFTETYDEFLRLKQKVQG